MRIMKLAVVMAFGLGSIQAQPPALAPPPPAQLASPTPPAAPHAKIAPASSGSYLGVMVEEIDSDRAKTLKLREEAGVEITRVEPDSPAEKAGLKSGDAILQYNGQRVEGMEQFSRLVRETPVGREVRLDLFRNGVPQTVMVKLAAHRPGVSMFNSTFNSGALSAPTAMPRGSFEFQMPDMPHSFMSWQSSMLGIEGESLEGQLAQYFGVKEGVLVRSVVSGSAAEKGGLKAGDVIVRVDDSKVTTPTDVTSRLRALRGKQVAMVVMRDHKEVALTVTVEEERRGGFFWQENLPSSGDQFFRVNPERARVIRLPME